MAQGRGPWKTFVLKGNMAKLSFNGGSEVFREYPGLFDVMPAAGVKWPRGILSLERGN